MWRRLAFSIVAFSLQTACWIAGAQAQNGGIDCNAFVKYPDGSWVVISKVFIPVQNVRVEEGTVFRPGGTFLGDDMAERLSRQCPNQPVVAPEAPGQAQVPQVPQAPQVPLSRYADANGSLDVQRLSCGHLADASGEEAELLLAWYSGWYNGFAKRRGINLARVRFAIHSVVDYCKSNRDKNLAQVMELMLK